MATRISLKRLFLSSVIALTPAACASSGERIDWHDNESYSGWVTDAATGKPIQGVVVVAVWHVSRRNLLESSTYRVIRLEETLTDKEGRFHFAPLGNYVPPPLGWQRDEGRFPHLAFFRPGYEPTYRDRFNWEHGGVPDVPREQQSSPPRGIGWQREIRLYKYLTSPVPDHRAIDPIYRRSTDESKILGQITNFASSLSENVDASGDDSQRRKAVQAQWHAIVMVEEEIRKYQPRYLWGTREIREALAQRSGKKESQ